LLRHFFNGLRRQVPVDNWNVEKKEHVRFWNEQSKLQQIYTFN
jgi:hypothetical protein